MTPSEGKNPHDEMPPALESLWRTLKLGYRAEPRLLSFSLLMTFVMALPDALIALWLALLASGVADHRRALVLGAALGLGASATLTWWLQIVFQRMQRGFRDRVSIALEAHVARLQAGIATIEHQERPEYLNRLSMLRDQVFALEHLFASLFSTLGWVIRLVATVVLLASIHPALVLLFAFAVPTVLVATWRPGVERKAYEQNAPHSRLARHLFVLGTTAAPGKEVRVTRMERRLKTLRRQAWQRGYDAVARERWKSAAFHAAAWTLFGAAYVGAIVFVASGLEATAGAVLLVVVAGGRLSQYVAAAVGELAFLRGIWLESSRRLTWLEDYAAASVHGETGTVPERIERGIVLEDVSFRYPGTARLALEHVNLELPAGTVVALVGENGAGKTTLVKLLCRMYAPSEGRILLDGVDLATLPVKSLRERFTGAFQDFFKLELQASRSVGAGDLPRFDERPAVEQAVARAGAGDVVAKLPSGLDTQLGATWERGVDVSFGQWQKIALARGFMRDEPLVLVLDEPTAALDAETEHALFERYAAASRHAVANGRVTVLVSHRFSTVRMADRIVVLDGAHVVEVGGHDELMARKGRYAELYTIQAEAFR
jgi:ATP-binding cassette subfamily B protein